MPIILEKRKLENNRLIFIGGAPGIGKSTVAGLLLKRLENSVWLDGDDVWRMNPFKVDNHTKKMVENNIRYVLNSFIQFQFAYILFTWVLHLDSIVDTILGGIHISGYAFKHYTLICDEKTLKQRIAKDVERMTEWPLAINRLKQSKNVNSMKIDTGNKTPIEIATIIKHDIISWGNPYDLVKDDYENGE